jgi:hypothetical protein
MKHDCRGFSVPALVVAAVALTLTAGVANASPAQKLPAHHAVVSPSDKLADVDARHDLHVAIARLAADNWYVARDRLERAETALLNREVLDLGPALKIDQPLPKTAAMKDIDKARTALASRHLSLARHLAAVATQDIGTVS